MAKTEKKTIKCPGCGREHEVTLFPRLEVPGDEEQKAKIMNNTLFYFECKDCGFGTPLVYSCLYYDKENRLLAYMMPEVEHTGCEHEGCGHDSCDHDGCGHGESGHEGCCHESADHEGCSHGGCSGDNHSHDGCGHEGHEHAGYEKIKRGITGMGELLPADKREGFIYRIVPNANTLKEKIMIREEGLDDRIIELMKLYYIAQIQGSFDGDELTDVYFESSNEKNGFVFFLKEKGPMFGEMNMDAYRILEQDFTEAADKLTPEGMIEIDLKWAEKLASGQ